MSRIRIVSSGLGSGVVEKGAPAEMNSVVDPDELSVTWLTEALRARSGLGAGEVVSYSAETLSAVSFTGEFRRLELRYDPPDAAAPASLIAKFSTSDPEARRFLHELGFFTRELAFYRELAASTPVRIPLCYYAALDDDGRCVILLEDLTIGRRGRSADTCSLVEAQWAIDAMAALHGQWWQDPQLQKLPWLDEVIMSSDNAPGMFAAQWPSFLEKLTIPITDVMHRFAGLAGADIAATIQTICGEPPLTLVHNDFQADNLLFDLPDPGQPLAVIDWQMHDRGRGPLDLAYFLSGSLHSDDRRRWENDLLSRYVDRLQIAGVDYDLDRCLADYRTALLLPPTRLAIAVGSTGPMTAHPGAFWDVLFDRQLTALQDHGIV